MNSPNICLFRRSIRRSKEEEKERKKQTKKKQTTIKISKDNAMEWGERREAETAKDNGTTLGLIDQ